MHDLAGCEDNTTAVTDVFIHALWGQPRDHKWSSPASAAEMWECSINFTVPTRATHDRRPPRPLLQTGKHMWLESYQPGLLHTRLCLPKSKTRLLINPYLTHKGQTVHSGSETKQKLQLFNADHYHFVLIRSFILFSFFFFWWIRPQPFSALVFCLPWRTRARSLRATRRPLRWLKSRTTLWEWRWPGACPAVGGTFPFMSQTWTLTAWSERRDPSAKVMIGWWIPSVTPLKSWSHNCKVIAPALYYCTRNTVFCWDN